MGIRNVAGLLLVAAVYSLSIACDDSEKPKNPFDPSPSATKKPPPVTEPPKVEGAPEVRVTADGIKVGFDNVLIDKEDGQQRLRRALAPHKRYFEGVDVTVPVDRKAQLPWVIALIQEMNALGAKHVVIKTETRPEFPKELKFTPQAQVKNPRPCSVVMVVREDRSTAVWKLSGGTAMRRARGFAGPDLTTTAETLERFIKQCDESTAMFVSAQRPVEWGLAYDLAASAQKVDGANFDTIVLLEEEPTPGRPVKL